MLIRILALLIGLSLAGLAQAQIKCWTGADGKRACGDLPPPGARLETPKGAPAPQISAPAATDTKKGTAASAPQDPNRGRQTGSQRTTRTHQEQAAPIGNPQDCDRARESLQAMGGGGRSKRTDAVKARAMYANNCTS